MGREQGSRKDAENRFSLKNKATAPSNKGVQNDARSASAPSGEVLQEKRDKKDGETASNKQVVKLKQRQAILLFMGVMPLSSLALLVSSGDIRDAGTDESYESGGPQSLPNRPDPHAT